MDNQVNDFLHLVEDMRRAQRDYFKSRHPHVLQRSIMLEKLVDDSLTVLLAEHSKPQQLQLTLFDDEFLMLENLVDD